MKWGLICRGEDRGLGRLSDETNRNLHPDRTLLLDLGDLARGFPVHHDRFPAAVRLAWDGHPLDAQGEAAVRGWLEGLDVVLSFETYYDWRILDWAREAGCASVLMVMPEFWRCGTDSIPMPDAVWAPTTWRLDQLPDATRLVPVPVALDRLAVDRADMPYRCDCCGRDNVAAKVPGFGYYCDDCQLPTGAEVTPCDHGGSVLPEVDGPLRVLHVGGHRAAADRNGTQTVLRSVRHLTERVDVTVVGQDGRLPSSFVPRGAPVTLTREVHSAPDYWSMYRGHDVLVMPRRYGGLCLPVQEGLAAGLVPVMPDVAPNGDWPAVLTPTRLVGTIATQGGVLAMAQTRPADLAKAIDGLARDRGTLASWRERARQWSMAHSWETLGPVWLQELERAR